MNSEEEKWKRPRKRDNAPAAPQAARVIVRLKGTTTQGDLYQGTTLIRRCANCRPL